ncbi:MAG: hypothetical protein IJO56_06375 [Oscillospiraceae bacterium]|nr:hypothetical protein [Oscillospiraceae bacterium]
MEQIRQILQQMALNLQLSVAMCDMLDDHEKRIKGLESSRDVQKVRVDGLYSAVQKLATSHGSEVLSSFQAAMEPKQKK